MKLLSRESRWFKCLLLAAGFGFFAIFTFYAGAANDQQETKYFFLRHAEFDKKDPDKPLIEKGKTRAQMLVEYFKNITVDQVYSTHTDRTYDTVAPLAKSREISIVQVPKQGKTIDEKIVTNRSSGKIATRPMIEALKKVNPGDSVVVAANSGNMFAIMAGLGVPVAGEAACQSQAELCLPCTSKKCFPTKEFDNIWTITVGTGGEVTLQRSRYGD